MLVKMKWDAFNTLQDEALGLACFEPINQAYKEIQTRGDDFSTGLYQRLSDGQKALFIFRAYYTHVRKSAADLYWWSAYFMAQPGRWPALKNGLRLFGDRATRYLLEDLEASLRERNHPRNLENFDVSTQDLRYDPELCSSVSSLYAQLHEAAPITIKIIADYIRNHPGDFVQIQRN
ncbi:hypothetical protein PP175_10070 [Aneurinibacillus sp. Ricciae_BoGa-3]|uniref:hypothetical protein n=1 Tax=Aneurinibacillus sp. Ricciae_BoGa-3 TaxID=3022697 RepID=UPI0023404E99|nr:hypothetical protein [Aneurinibacillus sp. Ricciae_BoGa-3]WCK56225.1 hypothetical protein PP175_10070 [Aneurinibacillus sp. Ricciae_BoGa-3]